MEEVIINVDYTQRSVSTIHDVKMRLAGEIGCDYSDLKFIGGDTYPNGKKGSLGHSQANGIDILKIYRVFDSGNAICIFQISVAWK